MAKSGFPVFDSDMHIMEPSDLWERYIDPRFRSQAPRGLITENVRDLRMVHPDGRLWGLFSEAPQASQIRNRPQGHNFLQNQSVYRPNSERGWTAAVQLEAMEKEGLDLAVLYPTRGLQLLSEPDMEAEFAAALARAYNDWLYDFSRADPSRLLGAGMVSPFNVEEAVSEARRCVKALGFRAIFLRANVMNGRNWHHPSYDPLWSTLEDLNVPLGLHDSSSSAARQVGDQFEPNFMLRRDFAQPMEQMLAVGSICAGGVLERHPRLRVAFLEANCSWLPWLLWRLDEGWKREGDVWAPELKMLPSEYFKSQCYASVEPDEEPVKYVIDYIGNDRLVFSTDYPHGDSRFPHAVEAFLQLRISDEDKRKILWDNCASFYGLGVASTHS
jgi:predicted TIM-barrel fold metal-dependent hydrolase